MRTCFKQNTTSPWKNLMVPSCWNNLFFSLWIHFAASSSANSLYFKGKRRGRGLSGVDCLSFVLSQLKLNKIEVKTKQAVEVFIAECLTGV